MTFDITQPHNIIANIATYNTFYDHTTSKAQILICSYYCRVPFSRAMNFAKTKALFHGKD